MSLLAINSDSTIYLSSALCQISQANLQIGQVMHFVQCLIMGYIIKKLVKTLVM